MPFLTTEAAKLSQGGLTAGVVSTFAQHQDVTLVQKLPFRPTKNGEESWNVERTMSPGDSIRPADSTDAVIGGGAEYETIKVSTRMLSRDANVPLGTQVRNSDKTDQQAQEQYNEAKRLCFDFTRYMYNGTGVGYQCHGVEYFLDRFNGVEQQGGGAAAKHESEHNLISIPRKLYGTSDKTAWGVKQSLSFVQIERALRNTLGSSFDLIVGTPESTLWMAKLLNMYPGNTASMVQADMFKGLGADTFPWRSLPVVSSQFVGAEKVVKGTAGIYGGTVANGSPTLTIAAPDSANRKYDTFIGFSSIDIGRSITISDAGTNANPWTTTIVNVSADRRTVTLAANSARAYTQANVTVAKRDDVLYFLRFGKDENGNGGFSALYNEIDDATKAEYGYEDAQPLLGFAAVEQQGRQAGRIKQTQMDWFGTFRAADVHCVQRLAGFTEPGL